jgi:hypothetical protein
VSQREKRKKENKKRNKTIARVRVKGIETGTKRQKENEKDEINKRENEERRLN